METAHRREHRHPSVFEEETEEHDVTETMMKQMRKSRAISIECQTDMIYTCPRITYKDQLPTRKVTANYSEKKPGMGRRM